MTLFRLWKFRRRAGIPIEACTFIGSSPIRFYAEAWTLDRLLEMTERCSDVLPVKEGLPVMFVTEDTTRAQSRKRFRALYTTAIRCGGPRRLCLRYGGGTRHPMARAQWCEICAGK